MHRKTDFSLLEPFLGLEPLEWTDIIRFRDEVLTMAETPDAIDGFRSLLEDLQRCPGKPLVLWSTSRCFSPERCNTLLKILGDLHRQHAGRNVLPSPLSGCTMAREENVFCGLIRWLRCVRRPVIMVFQGDVSLSFLGIGLACDYRIATSDTVFHNQGPDLDMPPGAGLLFLLPAYVGLGRANSLVTRTREFSAASALAWGLLDEVAASSKLDQVLRTMAAEVSCFSPETLDTIKQLLNSGLSNFDTYVMMETQGLDRALRGKPWEKLPSDGPEETAPAR